MFKLSFQHYVGDDVAGWAAMDDAWLQDHKNQQIKELSPQINEQFKYFYLEQFGLPVVVEMVGGVIQLRSNLADVNAQMGGPALKAQLSARSIRATGKWEWEIVPGQEDAVHQWVKQMEREFLEDGGQFRYYRGSAADNRYSFDDSVGGFFDPKTKTAHLFYVEEGNITYKAEELAHYFQYKQQGLIGKTELEIGRKVIDQNEAAILEIMKKRGLRPRR